MKLENDDVRVFLAELTRTVLRMSGHGHTIVESGTGSPSHMDR